MTAVSESKDRKMHAANVDKISVAITIPAVVSSPAKGVNIIGRRKVGGIAARLIRTATFN